jgi:cobalt/nickel transport system ATP-binding protein
VNLIETRGLCFRYPGGGEALSGVDFTLREGERVGLVGPTGSGKTTLLHIVMGLLRPSGGEVRIFGKPRRKEEDFLEVRRRVGFLFQEADDQLFCPTVEEDVAFGPLNLGLSHGEARQAVHAATSALGIEGLQKKVTHKLSGGEKRLVALATVIAMRPECYILDEPTSGLDEEKLRRVLTFLGAEARTLLVASHDRRFLAQAADRVFVLEKK